MADLTISTRKIIDLYKALAGVDDLQPPMAPKGRYALSKAMLQLEPIVAKYDKERLTAAHAFAKREDGKIVSMGDGKIALEDPESYTAEETRLLDAEVTLTGLRAITRAELGACPITQRTERVLLGVLLEDVEPAA